MPQELIDLLSAIYANTNEVESSLLVHRFVCKYGYIPLPAIMHHFAKHTRMIVWANELARATGKGKSKLFWFWNKGSQEGLLKGWGFNLNGCHLCPFTPGQLGDGSIVYGKAPEAPIGQQISDIKKKLEEITGTANANGSHQRIGYTQMTLAEA